MPSKFREFIDASGERIGGEDRLKLINGMNIYDIDADKIKKIEA